ncbi:uncharacterized protein LOC125177741 [Hyalella azteca]|uniref:Uncharacterized protein LOC125177741 n=1 Tax=Hyalella azteca TaxID=294128 RepID=A0A979FGZ7_HYAAZ|nr:uncharacterized protein LOC125177741 [Hyalella azteca]
MGRMSWAAIFLSSAAMLTVITANSVLPAAYLIRTMEKTSVVVRDVQINENASYHLSQAASECACRGRCFVDSRCIAHSYNASGACALSDKLGQTSESSGATYHYSEQFEQQPDGVFYNKALPLTYTACVARCSHPGMRIPAAKTRATFDYLKSDPNIWVGLNKGDDGVFRWSDGSELDLTMTSPPVENEYTNIFVIWYGGFDDTYSDHTATCTCQGVFVNVQA